jgi:hypothetical protein
VIGRGLERTAALWPEIACAYRWVHAVAHVLGNAAGEPAERVRRRFAGLLGAMQRHRARAGRLAGAVDHFGKVARSYRPGLFHCYAVADLPRTNNDLEQLFGSSRHHDRRATGRRTASPGMVVRGSVRLIAAVATRLDPPVARDLGRVDREGWRQVRRSLDQRRRSRCLQSRFRRDPEAYLAALERQAVQLTLPA